MKASSVGLRTFLCRREADPDGVAGSGGGRGKVSAEPRVWCVHLSAPHVRALQWAQGLGEGPPLSETNQRIHDSGERD